MTRAALLSAGFTRHERDGQVWFEGGPREGEKAEIEVAFSPPQRGEGAQGADEGSTLVLLHGTNDHAGTWFAVAPTLARTHRVVIPDLPGHGESEPHEGPIAVSRVLREIETLIDTKSTLIGNSFGGWMALLFAHRHPDLVSHLYLEASGGLKRAAAVPLVARDRNDAVPMLKAVHGPNYEPQEWVIEALMQRAIDAPMLRLTELLEHDIEPHLAAIQTPATLIWGRDDGVLPISYGEALRDALPNAEMKVIDGAAHIPHMQQPERFLQCLTPIF